MPWIAREDASSPIGLLNVTVRARVVGAQDVGVGGRRAQDEGLEQPTERSNRTVGTDCETTDRQPQASVGAVPRAGFSGVGGTGDAGEAMNVAVPAGAGVMSDRTAANPVLPMSLESTAQSGTLVALCGYRDVGISGWRPCRRPMPTARTAHAAARGCRFGSGT